MTTHPHTEHPHTEYATAAPGEAAMSIPETDVERTQPLPAIGTNPAAPGGVVVRRGEHRADADVVDAEIVDERPGTTVERRRRSVIEASGRLVPRPETRRQVADFGRAVGRDGARHLGYVRAGIGVAVARHQDAHGLARHERQMRDAEATGDHARLSEWQDRAEQAKRDRAERHRGWAEAPQRWVKAIGWGAVLVVAVLVLVGLLLIARQGDITAFADPFLWFFSLVNTVYDVIGVLWAPTLFTAPVVYLVRLWWLGRAADPHPTRRWAPGTAGELGGSGRDVVPDEGAIMSALRNLNLSTLNRKLKEGWLPRFVQPTTRDGQGWRTQLELPQGVTVESIVERKTVLAHNLVRLPVEVWPTEPKKQPGVLDLWVADQGVLTGAAPANPLVTDGSADYFQGVPVGVDQRGSQVTGKLMGCNYAIAGIMGSGKTSLVINLLCGAMLDPLVEVDVYCMAYNADYDPMTPRLRTLVKGDEDEQVTAAMDALRELRSEVSERGKRLSEQGGDETKLTRDIAENDPAMRPRIVVFDECQELFRHERYGEEAKQLAIKVMMKARKCGITLIFITPAPSADSLPRDLAKTVSHRVCYAIGDHQGNDAILGTGAHRSGITATTLVPGEDIGTAMASGFAARPGLLRTHHIRKDKGVDEITPMIQRALDARETTGLTSTDADTQEPERDVLADVLTVIGAQDRERTQKVLGLLIALHPTYRDWTTADLAAALPDAAKPYKSRADGASGVKVIAADRIREAITERHHDEGDDPGEDDTDT